MIKQKDELLEMLNKAWPEKLTGGGIIRAKRKNWGITLKEIEEATGISQENLSRYENDRKSLGHVQATKIGLAIGLHPFTILFPNGIKADERFTEIVEKCDDLLEKKSPLKAS